MSLKNGVLVGLVLLCGCGGVKVLKQKDRRDLYSESFREHIDQIKKGYQDGQRDIAIANLKSLADEKLNPSERAMKRNLIGVIFFAKGNYDKAVYYFLQALETSRKDLALTSQLRLNLAGSYFKMGLHGKGYQALLGSEFRYLSDLEAQKYHKLRYKLGKQLGKSRDPIVSLLRYLSSKDKIGDIKNDPYYELLMSGFIELDHREKLNILEELESGKALVIGYLGHLEAEKLYYAGKSSAAQRLLKWVRTHFSHHMEIKFLTGRFDFKVKAFSQINPNAVGFVLPLSGPRKKLGVRALKGFDAALRKARQERGLRPYQVHLRDSRGSGVVGVHAIRELVEKHHVGIVVGGLLAGEAKKEYLAARKLGVFFISLSQIYLPREQKDHLLLEIPGSVQSMVSVLLSKPHLERFGGRVAMIYPETDRGRAFASEFWRKASLVDAKVTGIVGYDRRTNDHRAPVKQLLGLNFIRERQEEYDLLEKVYALEKRHARRLNILEPIVDFDWVFIPVVPLEAVQIIPSFNYFDAGNASVIGGPSWRSGRLAQESYKFKKIYFLGDETEGSRDFGRWFYDHYGSWGKLIEMMAFDSFQVVDSLLGKRQFKSRDEFDIYVSSLRKLAGLTGGWRQNDGLWLKKMASFRFRGGKPVKF